MTKKLMEDGYVELYTYARGMVGDLEFEGECAFEVPIPWATEKAKEWGYDSLNEFILNYNFDDTERWVKEAEEAGELVNVKVLDIITRTDRSSSIY